MNWPYTCPLRREIRYERATISSLGRNTHQNQVVLAERSKKATEIHGNLSIELKSLTIAGCISATIVVSSPKRNVKVSAELMTRAHLKPCS